MRDGHLIWYFYAVCLGVLGAGLLAAGLRNPHARANIAFGILGWREKRKQAGGTGIDENNMEDDENE